MLSFLRLPTKYDPFKAEENFCYFVLKNVRMLPIRASGT